jgi:hypothetical protein
LYQNFPNPFRPVTQIRFELPAATNVVLTVYDAAGRHVALLVRDRLATGVYDIPFRADGLASGVYFYQLKAGTRSFTRKMVVIR